jgi:hypothetical protein
MGIHPSGVIPHLRPESVGRNISITLNVRLPSARKTRFVERITSGT